MQRDSLRYNKPMNTKHSPEFVAAAVAYAEALASYNETMEFATDERRKWKARDMLALAHEELNKVVKEHTPC